MLFLPSKRRQEPTHGSPGATDTDHGERNSTLRPGCLHDLNRAANLARVSDQDLPFASLEPDLEDTRTRARIERAVLDLLA
jgi:hypothetical protein